jgi:hypothetical protein
MEPRRAAPRLPAMTAPAVAISLRRLLLIATVAALAACTGSSTGSTASSGAMSPGPTVEASGGPSSATPGATSPGFTAAPSGPTTVNAAEAAVAAVQARTPWFDGVGPKNLTLIGQSAWWTAVPLAGGWNVTINVGWGDCPAGCIDHHQWRWRVAADGTVTFIGETGAAVPEEELARLATAATAAGVGGRVTASPVCPVQKVGDTSCDPRAVAGAVLLVKDQGGTEVARFTTDASGLYRIPLGPGTYTLEPQPAPGLMGTPPPLPVAVPAGALAIVPVAYDTGIR